MLQQQMLQQQQQQQQQQVPSQALSSCVRSAVVDRAAAHSSTSCCARYTMHSPALVQLAQMLKQTTSVAAPALRVAEQAAVLSAENLSDFVKRLAQITNFTAQLQKLVGADNPVFEPVRPLLKAISELSRACDASMQDAAHNIHRPSVACRAAATVVQPRGGLSWPSRVAGFMQFGITAVWCLPSLGAQAEG